MIKKLYRSEFIRFLFTGGINTAVGYLIYAAAYFVFENAIIALALDYIIGAFFNYKSYSVIVFNKYKKGRFFLFILIYIIIYWVNYGIIYLFMHYIFNNAYLAQIAALTICPILLYVLLRKFVFLSHEKQKSA